jgi:hypothetical protein
MRNYCDGEMKIVLEAFMYLHVSSPPDNEKIVYVVNSVCLYGKMAVGLARA